VGEARVRDLFRMSGSANVERCECVVGRRPPIWRASSIEEVNIVHYGSVYDDV
jgi:hypothetical protein